MDANDVEAAIYEAARLAGLSSSPINTPPDLDPAVHAQLAGAWALVAVARALVLHADRFPPT